MATKLPSNGARGPLAGKFQGHSQRGLGLELLVRENLSPGSSLCMHSGWQT